MRLKILSMVGMSAALAGPQVFAGEMPTPAALGQMESLLDSCSRIDPLFVPDVKVQREALAQGMSEKDLARIRTTDDYKIAYQEFSGRFAGTSKDEAMKACKVFLGTAAASAKM